MKTVAFAGLAVMALGLSASGEVESWNLEARQKFADQRFGIFLHWGLYSNYAQGEWYLKSGDNDNGWKPLDVIIGLTINAFQGMANGRRPVIYNCYHRQPHRHQLFLSLFRPATTDSYNRIWS